MNKRLTSLRREPKQATSVTNLLIHLIVDFILANVNLTKVVAPSHLGSIGSCVDTHDRSQCGIKVTQFFESALPIRIVIPAAQLIAAGTSCKDQ